MANVEHSLGVDQASLRGPLGLPGLPGRLWLSPAWRRRLVITAVAVLAALVSAVSLATTVLLLYGSAYQLQPLTPVAVPAVPAVPATRSREQLLAGRLAALAPRGVYVTVDSGRNLLRVYAGQRLLREARCSTGTGMVLRDPRDGSSWTFDTPLGERRVLEKRRNPVWTKPDWAFIEEGYLPTWDPRYRYDEISLGDYALSLGDSYLIHGTLFQTLLGRPVTHGCIRLGDRDLEYVYHTVPIGAPVYLY